MTPGDYVDTYLNIWSWIGEAFTAVRVRNYLQNGKAPQSPRAKAAHSALLTEVAKLAGLGGGRTLPAVFTVNGDTYVRTSLQRVFDGKGAPDEIQDALWLAYLSGLVSESSVGHYADTNLGIDCGGFVANYWGLAHPTPNSPNPNGATGFLPRTIWNSFKGHRKEAGAIQVGDAAVFFKDVKGNNPDVVASKKADGSFDTTTGSQAFHIGLVESKSIRADGTMTLELAESSGASRGVANGVNVRSLETRGVVAAGLVYCPEGDNRIYFTAAPAGASPSMPYMYGG